MLRNYNYFYTPPPYFQGLKCNLTNKYNHKLNVNFLYLVENPLLAMTALSLELMDITKDWVSSFLWCFARPVLQLTSVVCLWVFLPLVLSYIYVYIYIYVCLIYIYRYSLIYCIVFSWLTLTVTCLLHLAGCCESVFLYHGEDPPIIHHCCPPWTSVPFYVAELTSAFFFSQNVPNCWFAVSLMILFWFWSPRWNRPPWRNSPRLSMKQLLTQLSNYLWSLEKGGRHILKICNYLTFPPILMWIPSN